MMLYDLFNFLRSSCGKYWLLVHAHTLVGSGCVLNIHLATVTAVCLELDLDPKSFYCLFFISLL